MVRKSIKRLKRHTWSGEEDKQTATALIHHHHPHCQAISNVQNTISKANSSPKEVFKEVPKHGDDATNKILDKESVPSSIQMISVQSFSQMRPLDPNC